MRKKPTDGIRRVQSRPLLDEHQEQHHEQEEKEKIYSPESDEIIITEHDSDSVVESDSTAAGGGVRIRGTKMPEVSDESGHYTTVKEWLYGKQPNEPTPHQKYAAGANEADLGGGSVRKKFRFGLISGFVVALVVVVFLSTSFARVTITVSPHVTLHTIESVVVAFDTSISSPLVQQQVLPAEHLTFSRSVQDDFETSGIELVEEKARGTVRVYNQFSSTPQTLVATTRFLTEDGKLYRLPQAIRVPGAKIESGKIIPQFIEVELVADKVGEAYNLKGERRLSIPGFKGSSKYEGFYGVALSGFEGGFQGEARVVSEENVVQAQEDVTKRVFNELKQEIVRKIPPDFKLVDALSEIQIVSVDVPSAGTRANRFSVQANASADVMVFRETNVIGVLGYTLLGSDASRELIGDSADLKYQIRALDFENGTARVVVDGTIKSKAIIPETELMGSILGKKEGSIIEAFKDRTDIARFRIGLFPPWRSRAPVDAEKVDIVFEEP